jgi:hypothetical protein
LLLRGNGDAKDVCLCVRGVGGVVADVEVQK